MDLEPTQDQLDLVAAVREFLAAERPVAALRDPRTPEQVDAQWTETAELGWVGIALEEKHGGVGYGLAEEALLFHELGRFVTPGPFLPTVLAARLAATSGDAELADALLAGASRAGVAVPRRELSGFAGSYLVVDGDGADHALVWTRDALAIVALTPAALKPVPSMDDGSSLAELVLDQVTPIAVADAETDGALRVRASVLAAAMLAGMAEATRDISVEYAKVRTQFNKPIGTFQAVSRRCADMAVRAWSARSLVRVAALCAAAQRPDAAYQAAAARVFARDAAQRNAADNIQNLGATGWTAEHEAGFFYKRARFVDTVWGDARSHARILIDDYPGPYGLGVTHAAVGAHSGRNA